MKEIRIFLASSFELESDRVRIGNLIRQLNDDLYEPRHIHLKLEKWEDVESFYNGISKQGEYDYLIKQCELFIGLFWHCAGRYTLHEVDVAGENLDRENILIFRKTAPFPEDDDGSEDLRRFRARFAEDDLMRSEAEMNAFLERWNQFFQYKTFNELRDVLCKKIEEYCASINVAKSDRTPFPCNSELLVHVVSSPEVESDKERLGDLIRYMDENSMFHCRIKMIRIIPGSDMFVSLCQTSAPCSVRNEIDKAIIENKDSGKNNKPHLLFCMKYLENGMNADPSLTNLEDFFKSIFYYPDRYAHAPELKLHFILQIDNLRRQKDYPDSMFMLFIKNGVICQKNGEMECPLISCDDMLSLQNDIKYQEMKQNLAMLESELKTLKIKNIKTEESLSERILFCTGLINELREQINEKQNGFLRLACTLEEMIGKEQDKKILRVRELVRDGRLDEALKLMPAPKDQRMEREERKRRHETEDLRGYQVCKLTIDCFRAGNERKNRKKICDLYELLIDIASDLQSGEKIAEACLEYARYLHKNISYEKALLYYGYSLSTLCLVWGENHVKVAACYNSIGNVFAECGRFDEALEFYKKTRSILIYNSGENDPNVASCCNNIGNIYQEKGMLEDALEYYDEARKIIERTLGKDDPYVAVCYNNIGCVLANRGPEYYEDALKLFDSSFRIRIRFFGENSLEVATCYNNIGNVWRDKGDYDMALKNYKKALDIRLRLLAERHPIVADTYNNMGTSFYGKGRYCIALVLFTRALKIRILIFGEENPFVADSYNNKGKCLKALGRDAEADECLKKAFLIARVFPKTAMCQRILDENQDMK